MRKAYSNSKPIIQRLQEVILFPANITESIDKETGLTLYAYDELLIEDIGQDIKDREVFVKENWALIRTAMYAGREVVDKVEGMWETYKSDVRDKFAAVGEKTATVVEVVK